MSTEKFYLIVNRFVLEMILVAAMIMFFVGMKNANAVAPNEIWLENVKNRSPSVHTPFAHKCERPQPRDQPQIQKKRLSVKALHP